MDCGGCTRYLGRIDRYRSLCSGQLCSIPRRDPCRCKVRTRYAHLDKTPQNFSLCAWLTRASYSLGVRLLVYFSSEGRFRGEKPSTCPTRTDPGIEKYHSRYDRE